MTKRAQFSDGIANPILPNQAAQTEELKLEVQRLKAINHALIKRAEQDLSEETSPSFSYFYRTVLMEKMLIQRNNELLATNRELMEANRQLKNSRKKLSAEINRRKKFEKKIQASKEEAERADQAKTRFLAAATHDLLQPLNSARLFLYSLKQMDTTSLMQTILSKTEKSIELAGRMIRTTLDISKIDSGMIKPNLCKFPIQSIFDDLWDEYELSFHKKGLKLKVVPTSLHIHTDPIYLHRILQNFVSNSLQFTQKGKVIIGCKRNADFLKILVIDSGIGIKKTALLKIFDEFYTHSDANLKSLRDTFDNRGKLNMGLGLSIVKRLGKLLQIEPEVNSKIGKGSSFALNIPRKLIANDHQNKKSTAKIETVFIDKEQEKNKNLLEGFQVFCIENDPTALKQLMYVLSSWSCQVEGFTDFKQGLSFLRKQNFSPDFIIADYHLTGTASGDTAIKKMRGLIKQEIPAVLISADNSLRLQKLAKSIQAEFLDKPLNMEILKQKLQFHQEIKQANLLKNNIAEKSIT